VSSRVNLVHPLMVLALGPIPMDEPDHKHQADKAVDQRGEEDEDLHLGVM
jgi:hypothetical protein